MIGSSSGLPAERSTRKSSQFVFGPTLWNEAMQKSAAILRIDAASLRPIEAQAPLQRAVSSPANLCCGLLSAGNRLGSEDH